MRIAVPLAIPVALGVTLGVVMISSSGNTSKLQQSAAVAGATPSASAAGRDRRCSCCLPTFCMKPNCRCCLLCHSRVIVPQYEKKTSGIRNL